MRLLASAKMEHLFATQGFFTVESFFSQNAFTALETFYQNMCAHTARKDRYQKLSHLLFSNAQLRPLFMQRRVLPFLASIAQQKVLRFGFDLFLDFTPPSQPLRDKPLSLNEMGSIDPLCVGILLCLSGQGNSPLFPNAPNQATLVHPRTVIDWPNQLPTGQQFLLLAYGRKESCYKPNPLDPNPHYLKRLDYPPNSPLKDHTHPVFRSHTL